MSNITLNIVEPGSGPTPDPVVPNTGLFTHGIGGPEATILGIVAAVVILAAAIAVLYYRNKKQGKSISPKHKKVTFVGLASLAILASIGTVASLLRLGANATEGDGLTLDVSSEDLTIEVGSEPVFAVLPVELTVEEATQAGYTLTAYADSTDLVSITDESKTIPMVAVEGDELVALTDNTYGLALAEPESKDSEVYTALSTDADAPIFITDKDHKATEADDITTIYYGFYITSDVPYGTYTGSDIYYDAEVNYTTTLTFDGNDCDGGTAMEDMTLLAGDTITLPENTYTRAGYSFTGWNTAADGTGKAYADEAEYIAVEGKFAEVTLYAQWEYNGPCLANHICYRGNGASAATNMDNVEQYTTESSTGKQVDLLASNFTKPGHGFVGWSEDRDAWTHLKEEGTAIPTIYGPNQTITVGDLSEEGMKLYAVWAPAETTAGGDPVEFQSWQGCSSLTATIYSDGVFTVGENTVTALTDSRDGNVYTVARLADGNCWMVENLRLDNKATISTTNTNNPIVEEGTINVAIMNNDGDANSHLSPTNNNWCSRTWDPEQDTPCYNQSYLNTDNVVNVVVSPDFSQDFTSSAHSSNFDASIISYGNYYNWYSATAGNGTYDKTFSNTDGDICPKGWRLPTGGDSGEYEAFNQQMDGDTSGLGSGNWRSFPNNFVYSGYWYVSSVGSRGGVGSYHSSTAGYKTDEYFLSLEIGEADAHASGEKSGGKPVRCVVLGQ